MIVALTNQKGGVGKTTCVHNLGVALSRLDKKVLMADLDSQASLTISVGIEPLTIDNNMAAVLQKGGKSIEECITEINSNLHIVTSIIDLAQIETEIVMRTGREKILNRALSSVKDKYDFILIDCPPQLGVLTVNALSCADGVIIPVKTDYLSYRGLTQLKDTVEEIKELVNPDIKILGVIATLFESRTNDDKEILSELQKEYNVLGVIKRLAAVKKGIYDGLAVVEQNPLSEVAVEYSKIAQELCKTERNI